MIENIEDYFTKGCGRCARFETPACSVKTWQAGLDQLRQICVTTGLTETVKWGQPCYMHAGRNIVVFGALQKDFRISFFNAALLQDPENILKRAGPNSKDKDLITFTSIDQVTRMESVLRSYLSEAMGYAERGIKPQKVEHTLDLPDELIEALAADPELSAAFDKLTPGRQRSYVINLNGAKQSQTRIKRIAKFRAKILAGKGALDR